MTEVIAILLNNKLRLFLKRRSLHDILFIYCYLWVSAVINNSEIHSCKNIITAHFIILISVCDGANEKNSNRGRVRYIVVLWTIIFNWMNEWTRNHTITYGERKMQEQWFSTSFESERRFYIGHQVATTNEIQNEMSLQSNVVIY